MKTIKMTELKKEDIFAYAIKVAGREAFLVHENKGSSIIVTSRNDRSTQPKKIKKKTEGMVHLLRNLKHQI